MPDLHLAGVIYFTLAAAYMAFVARSHLRGVPARSVLAMAVGWVLIIVGLLWAATWMGWELP